MKSTITRFAIKNGDKYLGHFTNSKRWVDIWDAELFASKPIWLGEGEIVMLNISYEESPYEVE